MVRLAIVVGAVMAALPGCDCDCDGCDTGAVVAFTYPELDEVTDAAIPYLQGRPELAAALGAVQSVQREELAGLPNLRKGKVGATDARRIRMMVRGANGSAPADVVLVLRDARWVVVGAALQLPAGATTIGDTATFRETSSGHGWDD